MDDLDQLSDEKLSECFVVEVAGWIHGQFVNDWWRPGSDMVEPVPSFATDANAVLPWLEKHGWKATGVRAGGTSATTMIVLSHDLMTEITALSCDRINDFARAACVALIRAKRATK